MSLKISIFLWLVCLSFGSVAQIDMTINQHPESISTRELQDFNANSPVVKHIIQDALDLSRNNVGYLYGSADPNGGGMDCSGTVYYLLTRLGVKNVPRSSHLQYQWAEQKGRFQAVKSNMWESSEFAALKPGDLLFWNGTYAVKHDPNVTHVMIYIGKNNQGHPLMVGASNGRTYKGRKIYGVSVFDFQLPRPNDKARFLGYSCIPQLTC